MSKFPLSNVLNPFLRTRRRLNPVRRRPALLLEALETRVVPAGTWTPLNNLAPEGIGTMLLQTDGSVMAQGGGVNSAWFKLTADATGGYINGTWSDLASMSTPRLYTGSAILPSGKLFVLGGEYSGPSGQLNDNNTAEIYDPLANSWSTAASFPESQFGDDPVMVLGNGTVLGGYLAGPQTFILHSANAAELFSGN